MTGKIFSYCALCIAVQLLNIFRGIAGNDVRKTMTVIWMLLGDVW